MKKTILTIATFAALLFLPRVVPALKNFVTFDPALFAKVIDLPVPKPKPEPGPVDIIDLRQKRLDARAPSNLLDPQHELDHFYEALTRGGTVRIVHYGDSPTTGDLITADARAMLQKQFGDGGSGFVLIARPWAWYNRRNVEMGAESGWKIEIAGVTAMKDGMHGLGGVSFVGSAGANAHWRFNSRHRLVEVAYLSTPDSGAFAVDADEREVGVVETSSQSEEDTKTPGYASFNVPDGATKFAIRVTRGTVRLYGAEFRTGGGLTYSSLGINGANVTMLSRTFNGAHWAAELRHYKPDLVIVNYGTNESGYAKFVETTWGPEMRIVVKRLHEDLPNSSILLMSPMDRGDKNSAGEIVTTPILPKLVEIESSVAAETGTAFFNTYEAMGGEGTMARWYTSEPRLVSADFIHPMPAGAKIVGELLYKALHDGYNDYKLRQLEHRSVTSKAEDVQPQP
jgi:lysophospholipase L1-like esterase